MKQKKTIYAVLMITFIASAGVFLHLHNHACDSWVGKYHLQKNQHHYVLDIKPRGIAVLSVDGVEKQITWEIDGASNNLFLNGQTEIFEKLRDETFNGTVRSGSTSFGLGQSCLFVSGKRLYLNFDTNIYFSFVE